jgi:hypothetical protein
MGERVVHTARTPVWLGVPALVRPPALRGRLVVGPDVSDCFVLDTAGEDVSVRAARGVAAARSDRTEAGPDGVAARARAAAGRVVAHRPRHLPGAVQRDGHVLSSRGHETFYRRLTVTGTQAVKIRPRRGAWEVRVDVDGRQVAAGRVRLR